MRIFIRKILLFIMLVVISLLSVAALDFLVIKNQYTQGYNAAILDKVERLKSIKEPKIMLVGDSNVAVGFCSEILEEKLGMPVVNLGLHGGLDNRFHENIAKPYINEGDIVVLCHSYYNDNTMDTALAWITIEHHFELWDLIDRDKYWQMVQGYPQYAISKMLLYITGSGNKAADDMYSRVEFNEYGDNIYPRNENVLEFGQNSIGSPRFIDDATKRRINELNQYVEDRGARLVIAGYPIAEYEFTPARQEYIAFQEDLQANVDCKVISDFTDYFFPTTCFYDTVLHLTNEGAILRTMQLVEDLKKSVFQ